MRLYKKGEFLSFRSPIFRSLGSELFKCKKLMRRERKWQELQKNLSFFYSCKYNIDIAYCYYICFEILYIYKFISILKSYEFVRTKETCVFFFCKSSFTHKCMRKEKSSIELYRNDIRLCSRRWPWVFGCVLCYMNGNLRTEGGWRW